MKVHQLVRMILDAGGVEVRIRGGCDHRRFRLPNGVRVDLPQGGKHSTHVKPYLVARLRRALRVT